MGPRKKRSSPGDAKLQELLEGRAEEMREVKTAEHITGHPTGRSRRYLGWLDDNKVIWGHWGIDITQIDVPVSIWQGGRDSIIPVAHTEWIAREVPTARDHYHLLEDEDRVSLMRCCYDQIRDELTERGS